MLEQLLTLVKENAGDAIVNNPAIPNQQNDTAIKETAHGIMQTLQGQLAGGKIDTFLNLLKSKGDANDPLVTDITQQVSTQLVNKLGIDKKAAGSVVSSLIPVVMNKLAHKTNDPNDKSFTLDGIVSAVGGSKAGVTALNSLKGILGNN